MEKKTILEVHNVSKSFPGVRALKGVDLDLYAGEVHAIVGENGAGKSTLMKVLTGVYQRDEGTYLMEGEPVEFGSVHQSLASGISCIYQELTIVPMIDVARNLFLGNLPQKNGLVDYKRLYAEAQEVLDTLELDVSPKTPAKDLSIAQHQMIEIGRAITRKSKVIIMDEPTSSLTSKETEVLFRVIRTLRSQGVGIFYISHKLEEILEISDRISVFRDGEHISTFPNNDSVTQEKIVAQMIGREIGNYFNKQPAKIGEVVLQARGLTRKGYFENISFEVHRGEVLGFFGLVGAGRSEVMTSLFGAERLHAGEIYIGCNDLSVGLNVSMVTVIATILGEKYGLAVIIPVIILIGMLTGLFNGIVVTKLQINPFIATLSTQMIFKGIGLVASGGKAIFSYNEQLNGLFNARQDTRFNRLRKNPVYGSGEDARVWRKYPVL